MEVCGWKTWAFTPSAVLLITAAQPTEQQIRGTTHTLYFYDVPQATEDDAWQRSAVSFVSAYNQCLSSAIARLRPRLVVVEKCMLSRVANTFGRLQDGPAFCVLDTVASRRVGAKIQTEKVYFLVVPLPKFERARAAWLASPVYKPFQTAPDAVMAVRCRLFPDTTEHAGPLTVAFGPPSVLPAINVARAQQFDEQWTIGLHAELPTVDGKKLRAPVYMPEPYYSHTRRQAECAKPWLNAFARVRNTPKRVLIVGHANFCVRVASYVRSLHQSLTAATLPYEPAWREMMSEDALKKISAEIDGRLIFENEQGQG